MKSSGGLVYASDNKGMCLPNQDPQTKSATGTGTLTFSAFSMCMILKSKYLLNCVVLFDDYLKVTLCTTAFFYFLFFSETCRKYGQFCT